MRRPWHSSIVSLLLFFVAADIVTVIFIFMEWKIFHDDVIIWKHFTRYWPFVRGIHRSPVNSPHKGQWRGALMFYLICVWINGWVNNREAGYLRRHRAHYDVIVMCHMTSGHNTDFKVYPNIRYTAPLCCLWVPISWINNHMPVKYGMKLLIYSQIKRTDSQRTII